MNIRTCAALATIAVSMAVSTTSWAGEQAPRYITSSGAAANFPFSEAVWVGDTLYVSGNIGLDAQTNKPPADPAAEAKLVMDAIKGTVEHAGLTMDDLVSVTVYCTDLSLFSTFNTVYRGYFHGHFPARAFIGVAHILFDGRFEVQAIAAGKPKK
jgi:2-iminobutanoate/2-iminopropanoate deaminase